MSKVQVRYVGPVSPVDPPAGAEDVPELTIDGKVHQAVRTGDVITVPKDVAGEVPHWRRLQTDNDGTVTEDRVPWREYREHAGHDEVRDLGSGLLSQEGNWEPVKAPRKTAAAPASDDDPPAPAASSETGTTSSAPQED